MKDRIKLIFLVVLGICLFLANIFFGSVSLDTADVWNALIGNFEPNTPQYVIVNSSRLPQAITALLAGAALAISGLMLQTLFNNPLAAPSILGISAGSGLGVAVVILFLGASVSSFGLYGYLSIVFGAMIGAMAVLSLLLLFSLKIKSNTMLLVIGLMISYVTGSIVSLLSYLSESHNLVSYVVWGMGDYSSVNSTNLLYFVAFILFGLIASVLLTKSLNALLLGEKYAQNLGLNITRIRILVLLATGLLTAIVTAFCGPIAFIGLAVPHIARLMFATSNHKLLIPSTILLGAVVSLACNLLTVIIVKGSIVPLNAITPLMGAPVIIYVILNKKKIAYFN